MSVNNGLPGGKIPAKLSFAKASQPGERVDPANPDAVSSGTPNKAAAASPGTVSSAIPNKAAAASPGAVSSAIPNGAAAATPGGAPVAANNSIQPYLEMIIAALQALNAPADLISAYKEQFSLLGTSGVPSSSGSSPGGASATPASGTSTAIPSGTPASEGGGSDPEYVEMMIVALQDADAPDDLIEAYKEQYKLLGLI